MLAPMAKTPKSKKTGGRKKAGKYANPITSREDILKALATKPQNRRDLAKRLKLTSKEDQEALRRRLRAMVRDGQLVINRRDQYMPLAQSDLIKGRVTGHRDGFGFLIPDEGGDDLFLSPRQMRKVLHGDRAVVRVARVDDRGRLEGAIVEVIERAHKTVVGRFSEARGIGVVIPENKRLTQDILIPPGKEGEAKQGQIVLAELITQPSGRQQPTGKIVNVLGEHMAPGMEIEIALHSHDLPHEWHSKVLKEIKDYGEEVPEEAKENRLDLRDVPLVTIDGEDARDFDDAVYCEPIGSGWRLLVAIADVSAYVVKDSALDISATERATSVYFPSQVIPMLPEVLSNGLCSLNPKVERLCMVVEIMLDKNGQISSWKFDEALMNSHARLTYNQVAAMLFDGDKDLRKEFEHVLPHLENLHDLYRAMIKARAKRGAIDFETTETYFKFDENRKISSIEPRVRNDAHRIIEECMIAANRCAARFLKEHKINSLYRVHDGVKEEKVLALREFLADVGLHLPGGEKPRAEDFAKVIIDIRERPDREMIQTVMLRSLAQAVYSPDSETGHFGLSLEDYAHFTSPIRRYPDLMVHRAIRYILQNGKKQGFPYSMPEMVALGEHSSMCERRADEASRDVVDWLKCEYMQDKVGENFTGVVSSVTSFGLFVNLHDVHVEGLIHITSLPVDYYHFDPVSHRLIGKQGKHEFRLGDELEIKVAAVKLDDRKIDFDLIKQKKRTHNTVFSSSKKNEKKSGSKRRKGKSKSKSRSRKKTRKRK